MKDKSNVLKTYGYMFDKLQFIGSYLFLLVSDKTQKMSRSEITEPSLRQDVGLNTFSGLSRVP